MKTLRPGDEVTVQRRDSRDDWRGEVAHFVDEGVTMFLIVKLANGYEIGFWADNGEDISGDPWHLAAKHVPVRMG